MSKWGFKSCLDDWGLQRYTPKPFELPNYQTKMLGKMNRNPVHDSYYLWSLTCKIRYQSTWFFKQNTLWFSVTSWNLDLDHLLFALFFPLSNLLASLDQSKEWFKLWDFPGSNLTLRGWLTGHETLVFYPPGKEKNISQPKGKGNSSTQKCLYKRGYDMLVPRRVRLFVRSFANKGLSDCHYKMGPPKTSWICGCKSW